MSYLTFKYKKDEKENTYTLFVMKEDENYIEGICLDKLDEKDIKELTSISGEDKIDINDVSTKIKYKKFIEKAYRKFVKRKII